MVCLYVFLSVQWFSKVSSQFCARVWCVKMANPVLQRLGEFCWALAVKAMVRVKVSAVVGVPEYVSSKHSSSAACGLRVRLCCSGVR